MKKIVIKKVKMCAELGNGCFFARRKSVMIVLFGKNSSCVVTTVAKKSIGLTAGIYALFFCIWHKSCNWVVVGCLLAKKLSPFICGNRINIVGFVAKLIKAQGLFFVQKAKVATTWQKHKQMF